MIKITIAINIKWQAAAATGRKKCGGEKERKRFLFSLAKKTRRNSGERCGHRNDKRVVDG